ncbi:uncharacterized protein VTP21DRAFT_9457 [Calcarisporiella thermophila]|uniref:uncharacterized protein n=1 Tax=Calcarisporiella thermophila TaxID=911321 RepID=UPI003744AC8C
MRQKPVTLIIDNYDSYTFNLLHLLDSENVVVIRNDQFNWKMFRTEILPYFDNVIISPGPGRPEHIADFGICKQLLEWQAYEPTNLIPVLGVCLGHQGIAAAFGGKITHASRIMHGRLSQIFCEKEGKLFEGVPSTFWAVRYHSLVVDWEELPPELLVTAWCYEDDEDMQKLQEEVIRAGHEIKREDIEKNTTKKLKTIMGIQHAWKPIWGVQFHPESICTEYGKLMMTRFHELTIDYVTKSGRTFNNGPLPNSIRSISVLAPSIPLQLPSIHSEKPKLSMRVKKFEGLWCDTDTFFTHMVRQKRIPEQAKIAWLDSPNKSSQSSRVSYLSLDPHSSLTYSTQHRTVYLKYYNSSQPDGRISLPRNESFFDFCSELMSSLQITSAPGADIYPHAFQGGLIGYFGYEMKCESLPGYTPSDKHRCSNSAEDCRTCQQEPDAAFHLINRFLAFDRTENIIWAICLVAEEHGVEEIGNNRSCRPKIENIGLLGQEAEEWMQSIGSNLKMLQNKQIPRENSVYYPNKLRNPSSSHIPNFSPDLTESEYLAAIRKSLSYIHEGESYELCQTTRFRSSLPISTHELFLLLRQRNPAPFSAYLTFAAGVRVLCSSPERFFRVNADGWAEMKPIKGTIAVAKGCFCESEGVVCDKGIGCEKIRKLVDERRKWNLWGDVKERAENLMIVDLIRNDLSHFCDPKKVHVSTLFGIESYETVHQMVTTVRGPLKEGIDAVQAIRNCFPPGSMTGAPKLRSVQLLDELEHHRPRGVYSGCLGFLSFSKDGKVGESDFCVVIRTGVVNEEKKEISIGAGGAITSLSIPAKEWEEVMLKSQSVIPSVLDYLSQL